MELRYWLIIICVFAIILILLDAMRRKNSQSRYQGEYTNDIDELSDYPSAELPSGGAKIRMQSVEEVESLESRLMLDDKVPLLLDSVEEGAEEPEDEDQAPLDLQRELDFDAIFQAHIADTPERQRSAERGQIEDDDEEAAAVFYAKKEESLNDDQVDPREELDSNRSADEESIDLFATAPPGQDLTVSEEVIVVNVLSTNDKNFNNETLMELVLACGMRFGAMDIFHRTDDLGRLQFSMANVTKPGTFDIDAFNDMSIHGIALFMTLPCSANAMQSFEYMSETASVISRHLNGVIKDEMHNQMSEQSFEHCRDRIREFSRGQLLD